MTCAHDVPCPFCGAPCVYHYLRLPAGWMEPPMRFDPPVPFEESDIERRWHDEDDYDGVSADV